MADEPTIESLQGEVSSLKARLKEVNDEAKGHRLNSDNFRKGNESLQAQLNEAHEKMKGIEVSHKDAIEKLAIDLNGKANAAEVKATEAENRARSKIMMTDLRLAAKEAGMIDLDGLKLLDIAQCKADSDGNVTNAADLLTAMKEAKPYFFGAPSGVKTGTTTALGGTPPAAKPGAFNARTASKTEYEAAKREYLASARR